MREFLYSSIKKPNYSLDMFENYVEGKPNLSKKALFLSLAIFNNLSYEIISI